MISQTFWRWLVLWCLKMQFFIIVMLFAERSSSCNSKRSMMIERYLIIIIIIILTIYLIITVILLPILFSIFSEFTMEMQIRNKVWNTYKIQKDIKYRIQNIKYRYPPSKYSNAFGGEMFLSPPSQVKMIFGRKKC